MAKRVLLIGGTGLVGSLFAERAPGEGGFEIEALVRRPSGRSVSGYREHVAFDFDLVVDFAAAARSGGVRHMITISSVGADPASANFYLRSKGEMERALAALDFERLDIVRPGLLRGQRRGDRRSGDRLGIIVSPLLNFLLRGRLDRYAAINADVVAAAIAKLAGLGVAGMYIHHNRDLHRLARG
jgi:uncharacterized protein YbjT (DUF2867 family)